MVCDCCDWDEEMSGLCSLQLLIVEVTVITNILKTDHILDQKCNDVELRGFVTGIESSILFVLWIIQIFVKCCDILWDMRVGICWFVSVSICVVVFESLKDHYWLWSGLSEKICGL